MTRDELLNFTSVTKKLEKEGEEWGEEKEKRKMAAQNAEKILLIPEFVMSRQIPQYLFEGGGNRDDKRS